MTHLANLQRDQYHVIIEPSVSFGSSTVKNDSLVSSGPATVAIDAGMVYSINTTPTFTAGNWGGVGLYIQPPTDDNVPFRVKAHATALRNTFLFVGRGPATPTGTNDNVSKVIALPFDGEIDEIILVRPLDPSDPEFNNPLCIGVALAENAGNDIDVAVSVQKLSKASPTYASSVA